MENDLSIIIPIYNAEAFLLKMIDSIIYSNDIKVEIILINDGSTDNSSFLCKKVKEKYDNIRYVEQTNHGVSYTRNRGIDLATGKYILFYDADDIIEPYTVDLMYNKIIELNVDLVVCNFVYEDEEGNYIFSESYFGEKLLDSKEAISKAINDFCFGGYLWNKVFKKEIIMKNNLAFDEELTIYEDLFFVLSYLNKCSKICYLDFIGYHYVKHMFSAMSELSSTKYFQRVQALAKIENLLISNNDIFESLLLRISNAIIEYIKISFRFSRDDYIFEENEYVRKICITHINKMLCSKKISLLRKIVLLSYSKFGKIFYAFKNKCG